MGAKALFFAFFVAAISGCATPQVNLGQFPKVLPNPDAVSLTNDAAVKSELQAQLSDWAGTRYRYGGLSKAGIDCSGFTLVTYATRFGLRIPRTTELQARLGESVPRHDLQPGDLVFFKTGFKTRHVGIYAGNRRFLHASSSRGVMMSSLDNPYWRRKFWKAQRVRV